MSKPPDAGAGALPGCCAADTRAAASPAAEATMEMKDRRSCGPGMRRSLWPRVIHGVWRQLLDAVIPVLVWEGRARLRVDEGGELLRVLVGHVARVEVRHRIA